MLCSHERKKMYWEQLELRCRSLYSGPSLPPPGPAVIATPGNGSCRCCEQCHAHRAATAYTWDTDNRFWAAQAGNFYSPNPGDDATSAGEQRNRSWNWPRMPWQRNADSSLQSSQPPPPTNNQRYSQHPQHPVSSSDSQYGFSNGSTNPDSSSQQNGYSVIAPYGVHWGPPPPYSDPNSPARRGRYQYIHPSACHQNIVEQHIQNQASQIHHEHSSSATDNEQNLTHAIVNRNAAKRSGQQKAKENYENTPSDSDSPLRVSNTLPTRKTKKHIGGNVTNKSIGPQSSNNNPPRANVQNVFSNQSEMSENDYNEPHSRKDAISKNIDIHASKKSNNFNSIENCQMKLGIENTGFQPIDTAEQTPPNGESEVYFADVSSCCNIYEDANQRRLMLKNDADEYLSQRFGNRPSIRSRLPFPQVDNKIIMPAPRKSIIQKDLSRQSMSSIESSEKTDFTDLSPATPTNNPVNSQNDNFVSSFPSYNEQSSQEAHRRSTKNLQDIISSSPYETIKDDKAPSTLNSYELNHDISSPSISSRSYNKSSPIHNFSHTVTPTSSTTPIKRSNPLGTNITTIIQNLSGNDISLLYPENNKTAIINSTHHHKQKQDCNNDVINSNNLVHSENEWSSVTEQNDR